MFLWPVDQSTQQISESNQDNRTVGQKRDSKTLTRNEMLRKVIESLQDTVEIFDNVRITYCELYRLAASFSAQLWPRVPMPEIRPTETRTHARMRSMYLEEHLPALWDDR